MRLLVCNESVEAGGIGTFTRALAGGLRARGWHVAAMVTSGRGEHCAEVAAAADAFVDLSGEPLSAGKVLRAAAAVRAAAPDALVLNNCPLVQHALPLLPAGVRPVAVLHNDAERFYRVAATHARRVWRWVAPSPALAAGIGRRAGAAEAARVRTIAHGVDQGVFHPRGRRAAGDGPLRVAFVGHLGENKGADLLPAIFGEVARRVPGAAFVVAGQGALAGRVAEECRGRGLAVDFRPYAAAGDVAALLRASDVLLLPTRVEGFGLVVAEAMCCGAVPVASRLQGVTDWVVDDGRTGLLAAAGDPGGFAGAVASLAGDAGRLRRMSEAAAAEGARRFGLETMLDAYEGLLKEGDDRAPLPVRGRPGWVWETSREVLRGGVAKGWLGRRLREVFSTVGNL